MKPKPGVELYEARPVPETLHRAFDRDLVGVTPELTIHIFRDRLEHPEEEPTEVLTRFDGQRINVPDDVRHQPDRELVTYRWEKALEG